MNLTANQPIPEDKTPKSTSPPPRFFDPISQLLQYWKKLVTCQLCWQVTLRVFLSTLLILSCAIFFSFHYYEKSQYLHLQNRSLSLLRALLAVEQPSLTSEKLLNIFEKLTHSGQIAGASIYNNQGLLLSNIGNYPEFRYANLAARDLNDPYSRLQERNKLDVIWTPEELQIPYYISMRLDTTIIHQWNHHIYSVLISFVLITTLLTTLFTLFSLGQFLLRPLVLLRKKIIGATMAPQNAENFKILAFAKNELGDIIDSFNQMAIAVSTNISKVLAKEKELAELNQILDQKLTHTHDKLSYLSNYDQLTGLANRQFFLSSLKEKLNKNEVAALILFNIFDFTRITQILGAEESHYLIKQMIHHLMTLSSEALLLGRISDNEFAIACPDRTNEKIMDLLDTLQNKLTGRYFLYYNEVSISINIGVTLLPESCASEDTMLTHALTALYYSSLMKTPLKHQFYHEGLQRTLESQQKILTALESALTNQEFYLNYQAQFDLQNQEIYGFEVLIRWRHPEMGIIPPDVFIPLAEKSHHIVKIGEWVLKTACLQTKQWHDKYHKKLQAAVNISTIQLSEYLPDLIITLLKEIQLAPNVLELEITETELMQNANTTLNILEQLNQTGLLLAIDDFGTGYSSLNYLQKLPIHRIKIDRGFIQDIEENLESQAIVKAIIYMAHELDLQVLAEGIENIAQLDFLRSNHCDEGQGFYYSKPLTDLEFEKTFLAV